MDNKQLYKTLNDFDFENATDEDLRKYVMSFFAVVGETIHHSFDTDPHIIRKGFVKLLMTLTEDEVVEIITNTVEKIADIGNRKMDDDKNLGEPNKTIMVN